MSVQDRRSLQTRFASFAVFPRFAGADGVFDFGSLFFFAEAGANVFRVEFFDGF